MNGPAASVPGHNGRQASRLAALEYLGAAGPGADRVLQDLVDAAREAFGTGLCMANLITGDAQYFRAWSGELPEELAEARRDPRERSMCRYVVETEAPLVVGDLLADGRFRDQHFCVNHGARFYAGFPLTTSDGHTIGSLCLLDTRPREFGQDDIVLLGAFARAVVGRLELLGALSRERAVREEVALRGPELGRALGGREEAEGALEEREERLRALVRHSSDVVVVMDEDGAISYLSPSVRRVLGHDPEGLIGEDAFALVHPEDAGRVRAFHARGNDEPGVKPPLDLRLRHADGSWRCVEGIGNNLLDEPAVGGVVVTFRDVTERKEAEGELRRQKELYEALLGAQSEVGEGLVLLEDGRIVHANGAFCEISGYDAGELEAMPSALELLPPEDRGDAAQRLRRRLRGQEEPQERREAVMLHKSGRPVHVEVGLKTLRTDGRSRIVLIVRDVTDRKRAEEALRRSGARFRSLVQNSSDVVTVLDAQGTVRYASPAVERVLGYRPEERVGESTFALVHPEDAERARGLLAEGAKTPGVGPPAEVRMRHRDGSWRHLEVVGNNLLDDPSVGGIVLNSRDVTERKEAEEALRKSEATLAEAQRIAHVGSWEWDPKTGEVSWSDEAFRIYGFAPREFVPTFERLLRAVHPDDRRLVRGRVEAALHRDEPYDFEHRIVRPGGEVRWVHRRAEVARGEGGEPLRMAGTVHDVTELKEAEGALHESLGALLALVEAGRILGSTLESDEIVSRLLKVMQRVAGSTATVVSRCEEAGRFRVWRSVGLENLPERARYAPEAEAARRAAFEEGERRPFELKRVGSDGERLVGVCLPLRTRDRVIGVLEAYGRESLAGSDAAEILGSLASQAASALENARLYEELAKREGELGELVAKLILAQEEERRRVAYDIHDGLTQMLVAAHQHLQSFADDHPPGSAEARAELGWVSGLVQGTVKEARRVIADLRPTSLDDFGLATALRVQAEALRDEGWRVGYEEALGEERLPPAVETALFRVAQEALTNARKHARTTRAHVELRRLDGAVRLRVRDRGRGFDPAADADGGGPGERVGLSGMRERVVLLGGTFEVSSRPGSGTLVTAEVPLPSAEGGEPNDGS